MEKNSAKKILIKYFILSLVLSFSALAEGRVVEDRVVVDTYPWDPGNTVNSVKFNSVVVYRSQNRFDAVLSVSNSDYQKYLQIHSLKNKLNGFFIDELRSEYECILRNNAINSVLNAGYKGYKIIGEPIWTFPDQSLRPDGLDSRESTVAVSFLGLDRASSALSNPNAELSVSHLQVSVPGVSTRLGWGLLSDGAPADIRCLRSTTQGSPDIVKGPHQSRSCSVQFSVEDQQKRVWPGSFVASASYSRSDQFSETRSIGPGAATAVFTAGVGNAVWALVNSISNEGKAGATVRAVRAACIAQQELLAQIPRCSND